MGSKRTVRSTCPREDEDLDQEARVTVTLLTRK
jgi:hypothetical protein